MFVVIRWEIIESNEKEIQEQSEPNKQTLNDRLVQVFFLFFSSNLKLVNLEL